MFFLPTLVPFYSILYISIATYIYSQYVYYLDFQKLKKDFENLFSSCHKVNFGKKKHILAIFRIIFQKN